MKVSIVMPVFNVESYITQALLSITNQKFIDFEAIVVDDGSTDNSIRLAKNVVGADERFHFITHEFNRGLMEARRTGYLLARGDYIVFCDSDDEIPNDGLQILVDSIEEFKVDVVIAGFTRIGLGYKEEMNSAPPIAYGNSQDLLLLLLNRKISHSLWGKIFKRELFQNHEYQSYINLTNAEDGLLMYQLVFNIGFFSFVNLSVYNYHVRPISATQRKLNPLIFSGIFKFHFLIHKIGQKNPSITNLTTRYLLDELFSINLAGYSKILRVEYEKAGIEHYYSFPFLWRFLKPAKALLYFLFFNTSLHRLYYFRRFFKVS
jgi:glycosyltransferase involved in cell wall biosynthesis